MEKLFSKIWIVIAIVIYWQLWSKVIENIKLVRKYYAKDWFRHLEPFTKNWLKGHLIIIFLMSLSLWESL